MANYLLILGTKHNIYSELLLTASEDITIFRWYPTEVGTLFEGLINGQIFLWDL